MESVLESTLGLQNHKETEETTSSSQKEKWREPGSKRLIFHVTECRRKYFRSVNITLLNILGDPKKVLLFDQA